MLAVAANAQPFRQQFTVPTQSGRILVEGFGNCANAVCPAVLILSGSKGFGAPVYADEIGQTFQAAGLNVYIVHVLSAADLDAIATASWARARIAYYAQRLSDGTSAVQGVATYLRDHRATVARLVFLESPLASRPLRSQWSDVPILTPWCWSMVASRTDIHSLSALCRRCC